MTDQPGFFFIKTRIIGINLLDDRFQIKKLLAFGIVVTPLLQVGCGSFTGCFYLCGACRNSYFLGFIGQQLAKSPVFICKLLYMTIFQ